MAGRYERIPRTCCCFEVMHIPSQAAAIGLRGLEKLLQRLLFKCRAHPGMDMPSVSASEYTFLCVKALADSWLRLFPSASSTPAISAFAFVNRPEFRQSACCSDLSSSTFAFCIGIFACSGVVARATLLHGRHVSLGRREDLIESRYACIHECTRT
jgi:hypothetical protein